MKTRILQVDWNQPDPTTIAEAAHVIRAGGLVAFPTETVYGLAADATSDAAVRKIFEAKGRPPTNPLIVHVANVEQARSCVAAWPSVAQILADRFWPGPLSLILPKAPWVPDSVTAGRSSVGVRIPAPTISRRLIEASGCPLAAPSANRSTGISPTEAWHVAQDLDGKIDLILDAGPTSVGLESTVLSLLGDTPRLRRPGGVSLEALSDVLGVIELGQAVVEASSKAFESPGQMAIHYAPRTPTWRVDNPLTPTEVDERWAVLCLGEIATAALEDRAGCLIKLDSVRKASAGLYAMLHLLDKSKWKAILIVGPPHEPEWLAVRDRVERASKPWPVQPESLT